MAEFDPKLFDVERFAMPGLGIRVEPAFRIARSDRILPIGNCVAQQIEYALRAAGWNADGGGYGPVYSIGAMRQAVRWAVRGGFRRRMIVRVDGGRWFNGHQPSPAFFDTREEAERVHRERLARLGALLPRADVVVVVQSKAEHYYDRRRRVVLNMYQSPALPHVRAGRFVCRIDSHRAVRDGLVALVRDLRRIRPGVRVLLGVSPIPQNSTHVGHDAFVANGRSKSAMRSATAEAIERLRRRGIAGVDYLPVYELGVLRPREVVFNAAGSDAETPRHLRKEFVGGEVVPAMERWFGA